MAWRCCHGGRQAEGPGPRYPSRMSPGPNGVPILLVSAPRPPLTCIFVTWIHVLPVPFLPLSGATELGASRSSDLAGVPVPGPCSDPGCGVLALTDGGMGRGPSCRVGCGCDIPLVPGGPPGERTQGLASAQSSLLLGFSLGPGAPVHLPVSRGLGIFQSCFSKGSKQPPKTISAEQEVASQIAL